MNALVLQGVFEVWQSVPQCCLENFASFGISLLFRLGRFPRRGLSSEGLELFSCKNQEGENYSWFFFMQFHLCHGDLIQSLQL